MRIAEGNILKSFLLYKHQWNTKWAFTRKYDIFTREDNVIFTREKIAVAMVTFNKSKVVQRCLYSYRQRYSSSQWSKCCGTTFDLFFTTIFNAKEVFISERDQNHDTNKEQALSITFSQYDMIGLFSKMSVSDWLLHCVANWREHDASSVV